MTRRPTRTRIDPHIFRDATGYDVIVISPTGQRRVQRCSLDTTLRELRAWREHLKQLPERIH